MNYAMEHDERPERPRRWSGPDVILVAPSRCGKTPTTLYLALHARHLRHQFSHHRG